MNIEVEKAVIKHLIELIGDNPDRPGLEETPKRVLDSYRELFAGYTQYPKDLLTTFESNDCSDEMIVVRDIDFVSFCEHHLLPFTGVAHVGYLPNGKVIGLSKIARVVDVFAKRLQIQERMTRQVVDSLMQHLEPNGCGCVVEAKHLCMGCRGVRKQNAVMTTSCLKGNFIEAEVRQEFFTFVKGG